MKHLRDAAPPRKESEIQRAILDYLKTVPGVVAWRSNTGAFSGEHKGKRRFVRFGIKGMADILGWQLWPQVITDCAHPLASSFSPTIPRVMAIEVKRPGGHLTLAQTDFLALVKRAGGLAIVAASVDEVRQALGR